jgi:hypothetical protein
MLLSDFFAMILSSGEGFKFCGSFRFPSSSSCSSLDSHMYVCMYVCTLLLYVVAVTGMCLSEILNLCSKGG